MSPREVTAQLYYCAACDTKHADRTLFQTHKKTWTHRANVTRKAYAAKGWAPIRLLVKSDFPENIPVEVAPYEDPDEPGRLDQYGRGDYVTYVPQPVADAVKEWLALPAHAKKAQPLLDYLKTMFAGVDWQRHSLDEINRAVLAQTHERK